MGTARCSPLGVLRRAFVAQDRTLHESPPSDHVEFRHPALAADISVAVARTDGCYGAGSYAVPRNDAIGICSSDIGLGGRRSGVSQ